MRIYPEGTDILTVIYIILQANLSMLACSIWEVSSPNRPSLTFSVTLVYTLM